jgi:hypothetical protein
VASARERPGDGDKMAEIWSLRGRRRRRSSDEWISRQEISSVHTNMIGSSASGWTRGKGMAGGSMPLPSPPIALSLHPHRRWCRRRRLHPFSGEGGRSGREGAQYRFALLGKGFTRWEAWVSSRRVSRVFGGFVRGVTPGRV